MPKANELIIDQAEVKRLLDYDPLTGHLRWKRRQFGLPGWSPGWNGKNAGNVAGAKMANGYIMLAVFDRKFLAHRLIWLWEHGEWPPAQIDHINMDRSDNRIENLRLATNSQNTMNRTIQSNNRCGYKGVKLHLASGLWHARITVDGQTHSLGYWRTPEAASKAYDEGAKRLHGEFSRTLRPH